VAPLGYDLRDRALVVNEAETSIVKLIYQRNLELGWVRLLKDDLDRRGIVSKVRVSRKGIASGGRSFSRGALYELLSNPIYIGEIRHRQERHRGQHEPILERDFWEKVQARLSDHARRDSQSRVPAHPYNVHTISATARKLASSIMLAMRLMCVMRFNQAQRRSFTPSRRPASP
jgi:hypothetical protein